MRIPKALTVKCLCGAEQTLPLTFDVYEAVLPDGRNGDFVYCDSCQMPVAFELPAGIAKRSRDRYSMITIAQTGSEPKGPAPIVGVESARP